MPRRNSSTISSSGSSGSSGSKDSKGSKGSSSSGSTGSIGSSSKAGRNNTTSGSANKKSNLKNKVGNLLLEEKEDGWMTVTGPMYEILGMLWMAAQVAFPGVLSLIQRGKGSNETDANKKNDSKEKGKKSAIEKESSSKDEKKTRTIPRLLYPLKWIDWLVDFRGKIRDCNPLSHAYLQPYAEMIGAGNNTGIAFLLMLLLMWIINHYSPNKAIYFALAFVFSYLYGATRLVINDNETFLEEDAEYTLALKRYEVALSNTKEKPKEMAKDINKRFGRLWDAQDLIGTYIIMSGLHTWSNYVYDLSNYAEAWYISLLPVLLTTQFDRKSVTNIIVTALGLPSILNVETQKLEMDNEYLEYMANQIKTGLPDVYAYLYMLSSLTMLNTIVIAVLLVAGIVGLFFSGLQNYHVTYLLAWGMLILDSIIRVSVIPEDIREVKQALLLCCNLLCTWALLNTVATFERIPVVMEYLAESFPSYLVYKAGVVLLLMAWYGLDTELPVGPFGTVGGRGFANRLFLLINHTYIRDREKAPKSKTVIQEKLE